MFGGPGKTRGANQIVSSEPKYGDLFVERAVSYGIVSCTKTEVPWVKHRPIRLTVN